MISLVVIIIVTVILIGIAVAAGYIYLEKANDLKRTALSKTIGQVAAERQNNLTTGTTDKFYDGYVFDISKSVTYNGATVNKYTFINYLPEEDKLDADGNPLPSGDGIPDCMQKKGAIWYLIDAESASRLDADGTDKLLTSNIAYPDAFGPNELVRVVLVDYATGEAYYVTMPAEIATNSINNSIGDCPNSPDGKHRFTIATCTEGSFCIYGCGTRGIDALGHDFLDATCEEPQKCKRCGFEQGEALGHLYFQNSDATNQDLIDRLTARNLILVVNHDDSNAWITDANKHWHECVRCGSKEKEDEHKKAFVSVDPVGHEEVCSVCGWTSAKINHVFGKPVSTSDATHKVTCKACGFTTEPPYASYHSERIPAGNPSTNAWFSDNEQVHYRICNDLDLCNSYLKVDNISVAFKEEHYDRDYDYKCDVCGRNLDNSIPVEFGDEDNGSYAKVVGSTTYTLTLEAYTKDLERRIIYYEFGIYDPATGLIDWKTSERVNVSTDTPVQYTFNNVNSKHLVNNTNYDLYVRACDDNGNTNTPYKVVGTTAQFPGFKGLTNMPTTKYVAPGHQIGIQEIETTLPDIRLNYSQAGIWHSVLSGNDVASYYNGCIALSNVTSEVITLTREAEELKFKFVDIKGNESQIYTYTTNMVDSTPPSIKIETREGDPNTTSQLKHNATVIITDARAGILQGTEVKYAWSTSKTVAPTSYTTVHTENLETASRVTFDIETPTGVVGTYYLWIAPGVQDAVGNATTGAVCSGSTDNGDVGFIVDDTVAYLTNISMLNETPAVPGERKFVKTNGTVTIRFVASKELKLDPVVRINGINVDSITHTGLNYECKIKILDSFTEGTLQLFIGEVMSKQGKLNPVVYTNADITDSTKGPVYYDKTFPVMEYIPKQTH